MRPELTRFSSNQTPCGRTRREFLWEVGGGFAGLALFDLLSRDGFFDSVLQAAPSTRTADLANPLTPRQPHFSAKAKRVVFLFMNGAPSQVDTFDPKPALSHFHGTPYKGDVEQVGSNGRPVGHLMQSPFEFQRHGRSGLEISSLFPHTAKFADDLCVIRSMLHRHRRSCLGLSADEHRQRADRKAESGCLAQLRLGQPTRESALFCRHD